MTNSAVSIILYYCTGPNHVDIFKKVMEYVHLKMFASTAMVSSESLM